MDDNSLYINIEAIDDASEVLIGVSDSAEEMASEIAGSAQEMNAALESVGEIATESGLEASLAMQNMSASILSASEESIASVNDLNSVMATDSESIAEEALAAGTGWDEAAAMITAANEEIETSSASTQGGQAGLAAALLLVSQYLKQMAGAVENEIGNAYKATGDWNQSLIELQQSLKNTGSSVPTSELTAYAKTIQDTTLFQQGAVLQSENLVFTHKELQGSYQTIIGLSADLATKMAQQTGGTADLGNATKLLTNAFSDPVTAMNRLITQAGVDIPYAMQQAIEKTTKAGDAAAGAALLMQLLSGQIGGLATAAAGASGTGMQKLSNDFQSMQQNMPGLTEALDDLASIVDKILVPIASFVNSNPQLTAVILITTAAVLAFAAALTGIVALVILFTIGVAAGISSSMILLGAAFAAALAGLVAWGVAVMLNWDKIKDGAGILWDALKTGFTAAIDWITNLFEGWYNKVIGWINNIVNSVKSIGNAVGGGISGAVNAVGGAISSIIPHFATGGIVNGPTMALVGESGPEAIIPLSQLGGGAGYGPLPSGFGAGSGGINVYVTGQVLTTESQAKTLGDMIAKQINRQLRTSTFR